MGGGSGGGFFSYWERNLDGIHQKFSILGQKIPLPVKEFGDAPSLFDMVVFLTKTGVTGGVL